MMMYEVFPVQASIPPAAQNCRHSLGQERVRHAFYRAHRVGLIGERKGGETVVVLVEKKLGCLSDAIINGS